MTVKEPAELSQPGGRYGLPNDTILQFLEDHSGGILDTSARTGRMESAFVCNVNDGLTICFPVDQVNREPWSIVANLKNPIFGPTQPECEVSALATEQIAPRT